MDWEYPLKSTSYLQEAKDFWAERSDLRRVKKEAVEKMRVKVQELIDKITQKLADYGEGVGAEHHEAIGNQMEVLEEILDNSGDERFSDVELLEHESKKLEEQAQPLMTAITDAQKHLLNSAHEAIFAGEKDLLDGGFNEAGGALKSELANIALKVQSLKDLVMVPQADWNCHEISATTNSLTEARAQWRAKTSAAEEEKKNAEEERKKKAQELVDLQAQLQVEAGNSPPHAGQSAATTPAQPM